MEIDVVSLKNVAQMQNPYTKFSSLSKPKNSIYQGLPIIIKDAQ
jgi:hypothetical protein